MHNIYPSVMLGFGFLDNFIMIMAGEYIDLTLGAKLGISTMAAAALGRLSLLSGIYNLGLHRILNWPDIRPICFAEYLAE